MTTITWAQQLIASYTALLSEADHFNSRGQRLTTAAAIIRQNRANFHRFGIRSAEDQDDPFFADEANRAALEQMLSRGRADPGVIDRVVKGPPVLVRVDIYRDTSGPFIHVTLLDRLQASPPSKSETMIAQQVPIKYQGDWIDQTGGRIRIDDASIDFGSHFKETITSVNPGSESGEVMLVKYANGVQMVWYLTNVNERSISCR